MKVLFVHIPKNAGSSVGHALSCRKIQLKHHPDEEFKGRITFKHLIPADFPEEAKPMVPDAFKFTFVRDPYDRAVSIWAFSTGCKKPFVQYFEEIEEYLSTSGDKGRVFSPQHYWFEGITYDFVGRFENLAADVKKVQDLTDAPVSPFKHVNRSVRRSARWQDHYCSRSYDIVRRIYKDDFEPLGYSM